MKILERSQITKVITRRAIYHTMEHDGKIYNRIEKMNITIPNMNGEVVENYEVIWSVYTASRTVQYLSKKEVKSLGLEIMFKEQPIEHLNGHVVNHYDELNK